MNLKLRRPRRAGYVTRMEQYRNSYRVLVAKTEGKKSLGKPRLRREDNIKMDLRVLVSDAKNWIELVKISSSGGPT